MTYRLTTRYNVKAKADKASSSDEEILERMDIKTIENFLRKKKMKNINK